MHSLAERFRARSASGIKARLDLPPADRIARPARSSACAWRLSSGLDPISPRSSWASWSARSSATHEDIKAEYDEELDITKPHAEGAKPGLVSCAPDRCGVDPLSEL